MPNQIESYQKAIDIIADSRFDENAREILIEIMKSNPQIVVTVAEKLWNPSPLPTLTPVLDAVDTGYIVDGLRNHGWGKIDAIRYDRNNTGRGLKESKDFVENLIQNYGLNPTDAF